MTAEPDTTDKMTVWREGKAFELTSPALSQLGQSTSHSLGTPPRCQQPARKVTAMQSDQSDNTFQGLEDTRDPRSLATTANSTYSTNWRRWWFLLLRAGSGLETGTNEVSEPRSNGTHEYTAEACRTLLDIVKGGTEPASEDTINEMGW